MTSDKIVKGRYLVTGGGGFLGSHLVDALLEKGCDVLSVDNFLTGRKPNIKTQLTNPRFKLLEHDITKPFKIEGGLAGIFNCASPASPDDYDKFKIETLRVGSLGADNCLALAHEKKCRILVTSTSEVYGDPEQHPQKESYWGNVNPIGPRSCYDEAKRYQEALTMAYHRVHQVETRIVRIFNTYGPRMRIDDGRVVPNFLNQALLGKDLTVYGDGSQTRSFCYVSDLVEGILRIFLCDSSDPINLGNPTELTVLDFAKKIQKAAGGKSKIIFKPLPKDDPMQRKPDITRATELLGWKPTVSLDDGLEKTFAYFKTVQPA